MNYRTVLMLLGTAATAVCQAGSPTADPQQEQPAPPGAPTGQLAFARGGEILLLDVATGDETVLVADNDYDRPLCWMPDGKRLLFWNHAGGAWDLWAVDAQSKARSNLTKSARDNRSPAPAPDGRTIAFHRGGDGLWLMADDGSSQLQLHPRGHRDIAAVWAPDGKQLAFTDLQHGEDERVRMVMHLVQVEDGVARSSKELGGGEAAGFLDAHHLVATGAIEAQQDVLCIDVRDGSRRRLTDTNTRDHNPVVSPDRRTIAWVQLDATPRLHSMRSDGSEVRNLAAMPHAYSPPSFSPDSRWIAFETGPDRRSLQLFVVASCGGSAPRQVSKNGGQFAVWRPDAK